MFDNFRIHQAANRMQRRVQLLLFLLLIAAVAPFFLLSQYAHPSADDFCYASLFRGEGFWSHIKGEYLGWKGRYTAIFFTVAYHKAGGMLATYGFALLALLALLLTAIYVFVRSLLEAAGSWTRTLAVSLGLAAVYLGTMPNVPAGLYWLDGALQYQLGNIFLLLSVAALFTLYRTGAVTSACFACVFIFLAVGTTEIVMIALVMLVGLLAFNRVVIYGRQRLSWSLVVIVTLGSAALLMLAPGNAVRADLGSTDTGQFWFSFSHAWFHAGEALASWLVNPLLWLATAAFTPVALRLVYLDGIRKEANWFRFLVTLFLVAALIWLIFFGVWWAAAMNPPGRSLNTIYMVFLAGWFAGVLELIGVVARHRPLVFTEQVFPASLRLASLASIVLFAGFLLLHGQTRIALADLIYRAPAYDQAIKNRYARIAAEKRAAGADARPAMTFRRLTDPPRVLMYTDIQPDRGNWRNSCFALYFGLRSAVRQ